MVAARQWQRPVCSVDNLQCERDSADERRQRSRIVDKQLHVGPTERYTHTHKRRHRPSDAQLTSVPSYKSRQKTVHSWDKAPERSTHIFVDTRVSL